MSKLNRNHLDLIRTFADKNVSNLEALTVRYTNSLTNTKESTKELYADHMRRIITFLGNVDIKNVDLFTLETVQSHLLTDLKLKESTVRTTMKTFQRLMSYCKKHKLIEENPFDEFTFVTDTDKSVKYTPTLEEVQSIVRTMYGNAHNVEQLRYCVIIDTILTTANRIGETVKLKYSDIDRKNLVLRLRKETTKNGKEYVKVIDADLLEKFDMLESYRTCDYIFNTRNDKPINPTHVDRFLKRIMKLAGIKTPITLHALRRFVISWYVSNGGNIEFASKSFAKHSSVAITERYYITPDETLMTDDIRNHNQNNKHW